MIKEIPRNGTIVRRIRETHKGMKIGDTDIVIGTEYSESEWFTLILKNLLKR